MKKNHLLIISALVLMQTFSSCKKEPVKTDSKPTSASVQTLADDKTYVNSLVYKTVLITFGASTGDINAFKQENDFKTFSCATVTTDTTANPHQVTIDFGTSGCTLNDGTPVTGVITGTFTNGNMGVVGSTASLDLNNFYINGNHVLGTLSVHNKGNNANGNMTFDIGLTGGQVVFGSDGRLLKNNVTWDVEWLTNGNSIKEDDFFSFNGTADGVTSAGDSYTETITEPLMISRDPNCVREFIQGKTVATIVNNPDLTIDYGTGICDTRADATQGGVTVRINLQDY